MQYKPKKPPKPLFFENQTEPVAWACGTCGRVLPKDTVRTCCATKVCVCGAEYDSHYTLCNACRSKASAEKLAAKKAKAEKIDSASYDGPVYIADTDSFYPDYDTAFEAICEHNVALDKEARKNVTFWACRVRKLTLNAGDVVDQALEWQEHYDGASDMISNSSIVALQEILDRWLEEHASDVETWFFDETRQVVISETEWSIFDAWYVEEGEI